MAAKVGEQRSGAAVHFEPVHAQAAARRAAEKNVLRHTQLVDEREFLRDDRDARGLCVTDGAEDGGTTLDVELALVTAVRIDARQQLDQGRLARAVFTTECMDLAGMKLELHVLQREDAGKSLRQTAGFEERGGHAFRRGGASF